MTPLVGGTPLPLVEEKHDLPLVSVEVVLRTGAAADATGQEGLCRHAAELMRRGAGGRSREELDAAFDALGASFDAEVTQDAVTFSGRCLSRNLPAFLALVRDVICRPRLDEDEHERLRRETLGLLDEVRDDDATLAGRFFDRFALTGHPYGRTALGTAESLSRLARADAVAWVERNVRRGNVIVGFAGDLAESAAPELSAALIADLPDGAVQPLLLTAPSIGATRRTFLIDKPERQQSQIVIGHPAPRHADTDWLPLHVACTVFGGMFTSRLMTEVRVKRGWSYGASARLVRARGGHSFRIRVFPSADQTPDTLALVLSLWEDIAKNGVTDAELDFAKAYLEGNWAFEIDTPTERLSHRLDSIIYDLPPGTYERYLDRLAAVSKDDVNSAITHWWWPQSAVILLTATAGTMTSRLRDLPIGAIEVVPYDSY